MAYITLFTLFAPDNKDRNVAATFRTLFAMLTALVIGMVSLPLLNRFGGVAEQRAWTTVALIYSAVSLICVLITFFGVTEKTIAVAPVSLKQETPSMSIKEIFKGLAKSKYFYLAALLSVAYYMGNSTGGANIYYARDILKDEGLVGLIGAVSLPTMVIGAILAPILYNRYGKRKIMLLGSFITIGCTAAQLLNPYGKLLFFIFYALKGLGIMLFGTAISTLPGDVADWGEWKIGARAEGIVTSLSSFGCKVGSGLGGAVVGWILALGHYVGGAAVQAQSAQNAEIILMIGVPMALAVLQIVLLIFWDMDKVHPVIMEELKTRREKA